MKKEYNKPVIEIIVLLATDIISTSGIVMNGGSIPGEKSVDWENLFD